jgi:hypothetical protein
MVENAPQHYPSLRPFDPEILAIDILSKAFEDTAREFGEDEAMIATISIFTSKAIQMKKSNRYAEILCMNAALIKRSSRFDY